MKEIGGYIELDTYHLPMLHEGAIALNCGRNALAYLLKARKIKRLWIPKLICDSVTSVCERENVPYSLYSVGYDFLPSQEINLDGEDWFYFVNYYSQFNNETISKFITKYKRVIVDNAQSYFQEPIPHVDTLYTCRKYYGVSDGAFLYTDAVTDKIFPVDESFERMSFLLGRFERPASEFYREYVKNNELFADEPIKRMSKLTSNLLHAIDYQFVKSARVKNFNILHQKFEKINKLKLTNKTGTFMYPLLLTDGLKIRRQLQQINIYIPVLWPDVFVFASKNEPEYDMAENILPLPIDQRYEAEDMEYIYDKILFFL